MQSIFDHRCFGKVNQNLVTTATARTINPNRWAFLLLPGFFCHAASSFAPLWLHRWKCEPLTSAFNKTPLGISTKTPGRCDKVRQQNLELFFLPGKPLVPQFLRQPSCWVLGVSSCLNKNWTQKAFQVPTSMTNAPFQWFTTEVKMFENAQSQCWWTNSRPEFVGVFRLLQKVTKFKLTAFCLNVRYENYENVRFKWVKGSTAVK